MHARRNRQNSRQRRTNPQHEPPDGGEAEMPRPPGAAHLRARPNGHREEGGVQCREQTEDFDGLANHLEGGDELAEHPERQRVQRTIHAQRQQKGEEDAPRQQGGGEEGRERTPLRPPVAVRSARPRAADDEEKESGREHCARCEQQDGQHDAHVELIRGVAREEGVEKGAPIRGVESDFPEGAPARDVRRRIGAFDEGGNAQREHARNGNR